jgi:hypothetical protein
MGVLRAANVCSQRLQFLHVRIMIDHRYTDTRYA